MISASFDHSVKIWAGGGRLVDTIHLGSPVYSIVPNPRGKQIILGFNETIKLFRLDTDKDSDHHINIKSPYIKRHHKVGMS